MRVAKYVLRQAVNEHPKSALMALQNKCKILPLWTTILQLNRNIDLPVLNPAGLAISKFDMLVRSIDMSASIASGDTRMRPSMTTRPATVATAAARDAGQIAFFVLLWQYKLIFNL